MPLYDWQEEDLSTLRDNKYTALLAIETGGGKSPLAASAIKDSGARTTLVIAPGSTLSSPDRNWPVAVGVWADQEMRLLSNGTKAGRQAITDFELGYPGVYACTPQLLARKSTDVSQWRGDLLIVDEVHQLSSARTSGQRRLSGYNPQDDPVSTHFESRLALSGTYFRQSFDNAWATMRLLWPELDGRGEIADMSYYLWCTDRMTSEDVYTSRRDRDGRPVKVKNFLAEREPGKLLSEMPCVIQHKRREKCCEYHPNGFLTVDKPQELYRVVDLTPKQRRAIRELEEHYMTYLDDNPLVVDLTLTQKQRIRQLCLGEANVEYYTGTNKDGEEVMKSRLEFDPECVSPFADELLSLLDDDLPTGEPVVVYMDSQRFASVLVAKLNARGITAQEYSGVTKADLSKFGTEFQVLVGVTSSVGTGTDGLQDVCSTEVWMEVPVSLTAETQSAARIDRMGAKKQVQRYYIQDSDGWAQGRLSDNVTKRLAINKSMRRTNGVK